MAKKLSYYIQYVQLATYRNCQLFINLNFKSLHFLPVLNIAVITSSPPTFGGDAIVTCHMAVKQDDL